MSEIEFVLARGQNAFFKELARILRAELRELGVEATIADGSGSRSRPGLVQILMPPHEYEALTPGGIPPDRIGRMIFVSAEPPASPWFEGNVRLAPLAGAMFDINQASVKEFESRGIAVRHLQLGYSPAWDRFDPGLEREVDVAFLGCFTKRRARLLAGYAPLLSGRRCELVISDNDHPNPASGASFLAGEDKWSLLTRSRALLNVHRESHPPYFEWVRVLEAIHCGAVVVSESSTHYAPLEPGRHFAFAPAEELDRVIDELLDAPDRLDAMRRAAYEYIRTELPMSRAASMLAEAAERIAERPASRPRRALPRPRRPRGLRARAAALLRRDEPSQETPVAPMVRLADGVKPILVEEGGHLLLMNAGDELLPNGLERMRAALDGDPGAGYSYGIVQLIGDRGPEGIVNHFGWEPWQRIHTPVLLRRGSAVDLAGLRGAHVRGFVASSRVTVPAGVTA
jgi:Glycosyl transferases group 1